MTRSTVVILAIFIQVTVSFAIEFKTGDRVIVGEGDTIAADLFVGAQYMDIRGVVDGDVYAGCERITIDGNVEDDVRLGGREIIIRGQIGDGVIAFGQNILLDGDVRGDVIAYGGEVRVSGRVGGNLYIGCGALYLEGGQVEGKIDGSADISKLDGVVNGPVQLKGRTISFGPGYKADRGTYLVLSKEPGAEMQVNAPEYLEVTVIPPKPFYQKLYFYWAIIAAFILGLVLILMFKKFMQNYVTSAFAQMGMSLGVGALVLITTPVAVVVLLILILTIPTALVLAAGYIFLLYAASIFSSIVIGDFFQKLFRKKGERILVISLIIGLIITTLLAEVPLIGWLFSLILICFGVGSFSRYLWGFRKSVKKARK